MENLLEAAMVAVIGLSVVMLVLIGLTLILSSLKLLNKNEKPITTPAVLPPVIPEAAPVKTQDGAELVAVITAAIAASLGTTEDKILIRSIKRANNWIEAAKSESMSGGY